MLARGLPVALLAGFALELVTLGFGLLRGLASARAASTFEVGALSTPRWQLFALGLAWATALVSSAGWFELAGRARGRTRRLLWFVGLASWSPVVASIVHSVTRIVAGPHDDVMPALAAWVIGSSVLALAFALALVIAASAWREARAAAVVIIGVAIVTPTLLALPVTLELFFIDHRLAGVAVFGVLAVAHLSAVVVLAARLGRTHPPAAPSIADPRTGFSIASTSLWLHLSIPLAIAIYARKTAAWAWAPLLVAASSTTLLAFAWGVVRAGRGAGATFPRVRLVGGGALLAWWAGVQLHQTLVVRELSWLGFESYVDVFNTCGPLAGLAGMALVVSALHSIANARGDEHVREHVLWRGLLMTLLVLTSFGLAGEPRLGVPTVVGAVAAMAGMACLADACRLVARCLDEDPRVPPARVVT